MKNLLIALLLCVAPVFAGEQQDVEKVLAKYQVLLGLEEWKVVLHIDTLKNIQDKCQASCVAASLWDYQSMSGEMWVLKRTEYTPAFWSVYAVIKPKGHHLAQRDQRNSVVHELGHVVWRMASEEQGVTLFTGAINP